MAELDVTQQLSTDSQSIVTRTLRRTKMFGLRTIQKTYENISGGAETLIVGQVMGVVSATGNYVPCKSAAVDGSQVPRAILFTDITEAADGATIEVTLVDGGEYNVNELVFDGTDTLDTLVGGVRMEDLLRGNARSLKLVDVEDRSAYDNY